jgi:hypothetical protein
MILCLLATLMGIGQSVATNLKIDRLARDFQGIQLAIYDSLDGAPTVHGNVRKVSLPAQDSGDSNKLNAILGGKWKSTSGETFSLWQSVRPDGLVQGAVMDTKPNAYIPLKLPGGVIGESETHSVLIAGLKGKYTICTANIAGQFVKKLDLVMDDGNTASGSMLASGTIGGTAVAADGVVDSSTYLVCLGV